MLSPQVILQAAKTIRAEMALDAAFQAKLDNCITQLEAGQSDGSKPLILLSSREDTRERTQELLAAIPTIVKSFDPLAGDAQVSNAQQYQCPEPGCTETAYRRGSAIPICPVHGIEMVPVEAT